jgi:hypothetical protein
VIRDFRLNGLFGLQFFFRKKAQEIVRMVNDFKALAKSGYSFFRVLKQCGQVVRIV